MTPHVSNLGLKCQSRTKQKHAAGPRGFVRDQLFFPARSELGRFSIWPVGEHYQDFRIENFVIVREQCDGAGAMHTLNHDQIIIWQPEGGQGCGCWKVVGYFSDVPMVVDSGVGEQVFQAGRFFRKRAVKPLIPAVEHSASPFGHGFYRFVYLV